MKTILCLLFLVSCRFVSVKPTNGDLAGFQTRQARPYVLTLQEARMILGEPAHIKENSDSVKTEVHQYKSSYQADVTDAATNKLGNVYYMYEDYKSEITARKTYETFRVSNQRSPGVETLTDIGDEAYFHSDQRNFHLIIARKANKVIRLKINKVTSKTSAEALKKVAKEILGRV